MSKRACSFAGESDLFLLCLKGNCLARYGPTMKSPREWRSIVRRWTRKVNIRLSLCALRVLAPVGIVENGTREKIKRTRVLLESTRFWILEQIREKKRPWPRVSNVFGNFWTRRSRLVRMKLQLRRRDKRRDISDIALSLNYIYINLYQFQFTFQLHPRSRDSRGDRTTKLRSCSRTKK